MKQPDTEHSVEELNRMGQSDTFIICSFLSHTGSYSSYNKKTDKYTLL